MQQVCPNNHAKPTRNKCHGSRLVASQDQSNQRGKKGSQRRRQAYPLARHKPRKRKTNNNHNRASRKRFFERSELQQVQSKKQGYKRPSHVNRKPLWHIPLLANQSKEPYILRFHQPPPP